MPKQRPNPNAAHKNDLIPEHPKPWRTDVKPKGLHVINKAISKKTAQDVWDYFHSPAVVWTQRFGAQYPKTAHYNNWRCGAYIGAEEQRQFKREHPPVHAMVEEGVAALKAYLQSIGDHSMDNFVGESVNVHLHKPGWGLGAHYDDAHDVGKGKVVMITISNEGIFVKEIRRPRTFRFDDPVLGRQYDVDTPCRQVIVFKDQCYDYWRHQSIRNPKQTGEALSFTIRQHDVDGYLNLADDRKYPKGAPAAEKMAHKRLREKLGPERVAKLVKVGTEALLAKEQAKLARRDKIADNKRKREAEGADLVPKRKAK
jgi:hypothetical protein